MNNIRNIGIVRDRGQLTIPDSIRRTIDWLKPSSVVNISIKNDQEVSLKPHGSGKVDWENLWKKIDISRKQKGRASGSSSTFLSKDRQNH